MSRDCHHRGHSAAQPPNALPEFLVGGVRVDRGRRWAQVGDTVILLSYALLQEEEARVMKPRVVFVDQSNRIRETALNL